MTATLFCCSRKAPVQLWTGRFLHSHDMDNTTTSATMDARIQEIVEAIIPESVYLVEVIVRGRQGSRVVEVYLDSDEGMGIKDLASYSRQVGARLEEEDVVRGHYTLNVSSPGADRPLRVPRQFPKHVGRTLAVDRLEGESVKGELAGVDSEALTLRVGKEDVRLAFSEIKEALVVLPW